jgi:hypothetical protein
MTTNEKPILHARQIVEAFDQVLQQLDSQAIVDYAALIGALDEVKQRYEEQRRRAWVSAAQAQLETAVRNAS